MKHSAIAVALVAAATLFSSGLAMSADGKPAAQGEAKSSPVPAKETKAKRPAAKGKVVDINSASKAELKKLPGITDAEADKIIAGRPYLSKAHLVTRDVLPRGIYEQIKGQIMAKQKPEPKAGAPKSGEPKKK